MDRVGPWSDRGRRDGRRPGRAVTALAVGAAVVGAAALGAVGCGATPSDTPEAAGSRKPSREIINPPGSSSLAVFSPAVRAGDFLFLSGAIGTRSGTLELVEGGIAAETRQTLENIRGVLQAAGAGLSDVVKCTVFLADIAEYAAMNEVYATFFTGEPPARSTVAGSGLALGARVEIECLALAPEAGPAP